MGSKKKHYTRGEEKRKRNSLRNALKESEKIGSVLRRQTKEGTGNSRQNCRDERISTTAGQQHRNVKRFLGPPPTVQKYKVWTTGITANSNGFWNPLLYSIRTPPRPKKEEKKHDETQKGLERPTKHTSTRITEISREGNRTQTEHGGKINPNS